MVEARNYAEGKLLDWTPEAALAVGEIIHLPDGRAGYAQRPIDAGELGAVQTTGIVIVQKTTGQVMLKGSRLYWDHSASSASLLFGSNTADFYLGTVFETAASAATTVKVVLNGNPFYSVALKDGFTSLPIVSTTANPAGHMFSVGNGVNAVFDTAAEAQKWDALSTRSIAAGTKGILTALVCVNTNGDDAAFDLNIGLANGTHATDAGLITESLFLHINGNDLNLYLESDDGTTEVAETDSTVDFAVGTQVLVQWDLSDWTDPQVYINGVNVLPSSVFNISAGTGPWKLLFHMAKTANDSPGNVTLMDLGFTVFDV
jgi:predicted RecA/RadA family phage recombinase